MVGPITTWTASNGMVDPWVIAYGVQMPVSNKVEIT